MDIKLRLQIGRYLDYFGYLFPKDPASGHYMVSSATDLGKLLIAYVKVSDTPISSYPEDEGETIVTLSLPLVDISQDLNNKWLYYSIADSKRLQAVLKATFNMDFIAYYLKGTSMGYQKKEVIEMFIVSRGLVSADPFEAMHKRVYRLEQQKMKGLTTQLLRKAKYFDETLDTTGLI